MPLASSYAQDHSYPVQLNYKTTTGVPLPPLTLELRTPPPLAAETNIRGLTNLGLKLPLQVTFLPFKLRGTSAKSKNWVIFVLTSGATS